MSINTLIENIYVYEDIIVSFLIVLHFNIVCELNLFCQNITRNSNLQYLFLFILFSIVDTVRDYIHYY